VNLAIRPGATFSAGGFDYFGQIENLREHLVALLGCEVDLVEEPPRDQRLKQVIEREGVRAFEPPRDPVPGYPRQYPASLDFHRAESA
jgi:hypothetical protein